MIPKSKKGEKNKKKENEIKEIKKLRDIEELNNKNKKESINLDRKNKKEKEKNEINELKKIGEREEKILLFEGEIRSKERQELEILKERLERRKEELERQKEEELQRIRKEKLKLQKEEELKRIKKEKLERQKEEELKRMKKEKEKLKLQKEEELERIRKEKLERKKEEELQRIKKEEEMKNQKKLIIERQLEYRKAQYQKNNQRIPEKIEKILEDMSILGYIMKEEIIEEKIKNSQKFISIKEATKEENKYEGIFCLGLLAKSLENIGIVTAIEKNSSKDEKSQNIANIVLNFITNGMIDKKKYDLHFEFDDKKNNELLYNKKEQEKFHNKLRKKLSVEYKIPESKIIITNPRKGSYIVQVIFCTNDFNNINIDINTLKNNCDDKEFNELKNLRKIHTKLIMEGCKLSPDMLDPKGNRESGWGKNELRGGFKYIPPKGWKGFGLKVLDKYDNGNNDWLAHNGNINEWAIAYHGIGAGENCNSVEEATHDIFIGEFKAGKGQIHQYDININKRYKPKSNAPNDDHSKIVGTGVYCSPNPDVMDHYSKSSTITINGKNYKMGFMMRVKPDKIRISNKKPEYWVLDGTTDEMRPYRIMVKEN